MNGMVLVSDSTNVLYWGGALGRTIYAQTPHQMTSVNLGVVYMIPARLSFRYKFIPVPSCVSLFFYMIPAQNIIRRSLYRSEIFIPVENSFRCHINAARLFVPA